MREIKFRAWGVFDPHFGKPIKEMRDNVGIIDGSAFIIEQPFGSGASSGFSPLKAESAIVMQYTGLKDKNGKEIYEGDIIKVLSSISSEVFLVEMHRGNASYCSKPDCPLGAIYPTMVNMTKEVIGNIYENPELLEDK